MLVEAVSAMPSGHLLGKPGVHRAVVLLGGDHSGSVGSELDECSWKRSDSCLVRLQFYLLEFVTVKGSELKMQ